MNKQNAGWSHCFGPLVYTFDFPVILKPIALLIVSPTYSMVVLFHYSASSRNCFTDIRIKLLCKVKAVTIVELALTISVKNIMSDIRCVALCTWPRPTQPTLLTYWLRRNPVESATFSVGDACCLAHLDTRCRVSATVGIVCVRLWRPPLACYREKK